ncbi:hypothetical protein EN742_10380 [Mesorhizobium sp. M4A.F.Ca.ET.020.02.1.1]|uniref:hypothetical protein n=1 Tax=unclassified Mesorhizobium TaxID=325217 RepID=UPI000FD5D053|nr:MULTISPECIES: hypothetical protein [unclassified Mesorhizobium]RVD41367.1 hypothetical protein EN742_10380 [Mesorhizobium sp. M4A.F.Ca.ET.020.02.1.1]RWC20631.1 MAG: hypothetical protein EOS53_08640 [Mesorhizobium sp.]RWC94761.1 MAG: hypothetical protein EOS32_15690 [Mesorhizobium sp.]
MLGRKQLVADAGPTAPVDRKRAQDAALAVAFNSSGIYLGISIGTAIGSHAIGIGTSTALWYGCALALAALFYMLVTTALRSTTSASAEDTHKPMRP